MKVINLNYGHFDSYPEAYGVMKKRFPSATVFAKDGKYSIRVSFSTKEGFFDDFLAKNPDFWIN